MGPLHEEVLKKMRWRQPADHSSVAWAGAGWAGAGWAGADRVGGRRAGGGWADARRAGGSLTITTLAGRTGLRLTGEADVGNHGQLRKALATLPADANPAIHLELAGLQFIDVACARELIALTRSHPGVCLILHNPPHLLQRLIALLWPDAGVQIHVRSTP